MTDRSESQNPKLQDPNPDLAFAQDKEQDGALAGELGNIALEGGTEDTEHGRLGARLKGVQRRKRARPGTDCEVLVSKMRMVKKKEESDG